MWKFSFSRELIFFSLQMFNRGVSHAHSFLLAYFSSLIIDEDLF